MVTEALIKLAVGIATGLFSIMPSWGVDTSSLTTLDSTSARLGSLNNWAPVTTLLLCITVILGVRLFFLAWAGVVFVYRLIPFNG